MTRPLLPRICLFATLCVLSATAAYSHSGGIDSQGGHNTNQPVATTSTMDRSLVRFSPRRRLPPLHSKVKSHQSRQNRQLRCSPPYQRTKSASPHSTSASTPLKAAIIPNSH